MELNALCTPELCVSFLVKFIFELDPTLISLRCLDSLFGLVLFVIWYGSNLISFYTDTFFDVLYTAYCDRNINVSRLRRVIRIDTDNTQIKT